MGEDQLADAGVSVDQIADLTATNRSTVVRIYRKFSPDYLLPEAEFLSNLPGRQPPTMPEVPEIPGPPVVGAAGIEPATPTMSRMVQSAQTAGNRENLRF